MRSATLEPVRVPGASGASAGASAALGAGASSGTSAGASAGASVPKWVPVRALASGRKCSDTSMPSVSPSGQEENPTLTIPSAGSSVTRETSSA
jgi:hypothetical protein